MPWFAKMMMFAIIPVFIWIIFNYLGGGLTLTQFMVRGVALLLAGFVLYKISISES